MTWNQELILKQETNLISLKNTNQFCVFFFANFLFFVYNKYMVNLDNILGKKNLPIEDDPFRNGLEDIETPTISKDELEELEKKQAEDAKRLGEEIKKEDLSDLKIEE